MTAKHERRLLALIALAALPDLPGMGRRYTHARDQRRDPEIAKRDLATAYVAHRRQEWTNGDASCVVSVRRHPLRIVRPA